MTRYYRKIIRITAEDSPNVRLAQAEIRAGKEPSHEILIPGVLPYADYVKRRQTWDEIRQTIGLDARFYKGASVLLYPPQWLNWCAIKAGNYAFQRREAISVGVDPAEGGDKTAYCVIDQHGIIELISKKTPDPTVIVDDVIQLIQRYNVPPWRVMIDKGGGGHQHKMYLSKRGYKVRTVGFGEPVNLEVGQVARGNEQKREVKEERYVYKNRRAQMYGILSLLMDPMGENQGFGIPPGYVELRKQLAPIPKTYDNEGRLVLLPKHVPPDSDLPSLTKLIGHSPDEADALCLAIYGMVCVKKPMKIGGF